MQYFLLGIERLRLFSHRFQQVAFNQSQLGIERHVCCINNVLTKIFVLYSAEDKQFAVTRGLNPPSYGTAGDCYSAQGKCPQVKLYKINKWKESSVRLPIHIKVLISIERVPRQPEIPKVYHLQIKKVFYTVSTHTLTFYPRFEVKIKVALSAKWNYGRSFVCKFLPSVAWCVIMLCRQMLSFPAVSIFRVGLASIYKILASS